MPTDLLACRRYSSGVQVNDLSGMMEGGDSLQEIIDALQLEEKRQMLLEFQP
jgi:protein subunit release factor A